MLVPPSAALGATLGAALPVPLAGLPLPQLIVNGLALGSLYALTAFGIVLIYKTSDVVTFAQGELAMFSTFIAFALLNPARVSTSRTVVLALLFGGLLTFALFTLLNLGRLARAYASGLALALGAASSLGAYTLLGRVRFPFALAFVLALVFAGCLGVAVERTIIRPVWNTTLLNPVIVTIGLGLILYGVAGWIWSYNPTTFPAPVAGAPLRLGGVVLSRLNALILLVTLALMAVLFLFFRYSLTGTAMRAVAQNRLAARLMGVSVDRMNALGWGLGTALGAVTGLLIAPLNYLDPNMMGDVALKAFAAAVLGGFTSLPGAVVGGLALGVVDSIFGFDHPELRTSIAFALIVLVLVIRPAGLLGQRVVKKV